MVTNLPAEARAKWIKVMEAKTPEEKVRSLEEFLSSVPKHKGTEKLRGWATKRLSQLREEIEDKRRKKSGSRSTFFLEKEGDVQVAVVGPPNSGKSSLVARLTGAKTVVANYPFATKHPVPGMLKYRDVYFQLIDTPPLFNGSSLFSKVVGIIRNADGLLLVLDATSDFIEDLKWIVETLKEEGILLVKPRGRVSIDISRAGKTGIRVTIMGKLVGTTVDDIRKLLESYRIYNAHVKIYGEVNLDDVEQALFEASSYKPTVVFINKTDIAKVERRSLDRVNELLPDPRIISGSALQDGGLNSIAPALYDVMEVVRVYTKSPNAPPSTKPIVLRKNATVRDVARIVHSDFIENFLYAKVWGLSAKYPGERVGLDHILYDGDIVEIRTKG
ncbi:MAG: TGS domain-containing protein [Desulfurococcaceae archaeon]